jgi:ankyrin repeat protein
MADNAPTFDDRRTKATFDLFKELGCLRDGGGDGELTIDDVGRLDVEKMMARALDCVAAVCEAQRVRVELEQPMTLREDGEALTPEQQEVRNKVFLEALKAVAKGLTHDGGELDWQPWSKRQLLRAFPDSGKLADGRGWLPMHWAVAMDEGGESGVTEADVMCVYETDLMALRKHHLLTVRATDVSDWTFGYTAAHLLCGMEMTQRNMSLVRHFSVSDPRAFTMKVADEATAEHSFSALHVACFSNRRTEALLRLLVQLDTSQMKAIATQGGPLGLLCAHSVKLDERQSGCLLEADSSVETVYDGITRCFARSAFKDRVQVVAKLLEVNPAAAQHRNRYGYNLAHHACKYQDRMTDAERIEILKLVLARHKDALKEATNLSGKLPSHVAAERCSMPVLSFLLDEYPDAATAVVDSESWNLLHYASLRLGPDEYRAAKVRLLCTRYPALMVQRNDDGRTPLLHSCTEKEAATTLMLCKAGGREAASTAVVHPTDAQYIHNGQLPLHWLISCERITLKADLLSPAADAFRLLLRLYPEAAGIEGGVGADYNVTPYRIAVSRELPAYYLRLLLRAAPQLDPMELRRLNWEERRMAMFMAFVGVSRTPSPLARLRAANKDLVKHVVSFL